MNKLVYNAYAVFFVFIVFLWSLLSYADKEGVLTKEFFNGNLLPELIGFGLEGLLFVGLFAVYRNLKEKDRVRSVHLRIADAISIFPKGVAFQVEDKGLFSAENISGLFRNLDERQGFAYDAVTTTLYYLHGKISDDREELSFEYMYGIYSPIIKHAEFSKARLDELLGLAGSLSIDYLDRFNLLRQILEEMNGLNEGFEKNHIKNSAHAFMLVKRYNEIAESFV